MDVFVASSVGEALMDVRAVNLADTAFILSFNDISSPQAAKIHLEVSRKAEARKVITNYVNLSQHYSRRL
jgi:hypothetical protein